MSIAVVQVTDARAACVISVVHDTAAEASATMEFTQVAEAFGPSNLIESMVTCSGRNLSTNRTTRGEESL